jgi:transcriptional regulator with XRE-family HTH domain
MPLSGLGLALRSFRERKGLTQRDLAKIAGLSDAAISKIEKGRRLPDGRSLNDLLRALEVDLHELALALDEVNGRVAQVPPPQYWINGDGERVRLFRALASITERLSALEKGRDRLTDGADGQGSDQGSEENR